MTDHTPEIIPAVEATCQATGLTEGERCSVCGEILVPQEETEKLPHTLKKKWGAYPTCTTPGYTSELSCTVSSAFVGLCHSMLTMPLLLTVKHMHS